MKTKNRTEKLYGRIKKRTFSGVVCEQEIYTVSPYGYKKTAGNEPRLRFNSEAERAAHREGISRRKHARLINANFRPGDLYVTLTFNGRNECHGYEACWILLRRYIKRIRKKYPHAKLAYYAGRGENTNRFHVHILAGGVPEDFLIKKWGYGEVEDIKPLWAHCIYDGVDHGADYTALANYLFDHWEPEQGPHRYHHTRNFEQPEEEDYTECRRNYNEENPPKAPKGYKLVESKITRYGYMYFKYVKEPKAAFLDFDADIRKPKRIRKRRIRRSTPGEELS